MVILRRVPQQNGLRGIEPAAHKEPRHIWPKLSFQMSGSIEYVETELGRFELLVDDYEKQHIGQCMLTTSIL